jgi:serine/threonine-protein kinase
VDRDDKLISLAARVADGSAIDWIASESAAADLDGRALLNELRAIADVATAHRAPAPFSETVLSDAVTWGSLTIISTIGTGRFGDVYLAWDARLHRRVALKLLHLPSSSHQLPTRSIEEARLLARVRHPNVLTVHGAECIGEQVGMWTEYIEGKTLDALLAERGRFDPVEVTELGRDLCRALAAVHDAGLLHRDIKAQNVMRETGGRIVLMDLGAGHDLALTPARDGDFTGTPLYLAPEVLAGSAASPASDVYALGVLLFHLLTGTHPVTGRTLADVRAAHSAGTVASLRTLWPEVPDGLAGAIARALSADPADRFGSARDFERALHARSALPPVSSEAVGRDTGASRPGGWLKRPLAVWATTLAVAAILATAASLYLSRSAPSFQARDFVLVTRFENRTGDPGLDGLLDNAIASDLSSSQFVNVVPPERIADTLGLMRRPLDTALDAELAREICLRDGNIKALLTGSVEQVGSSYVLTATLIDPFRNTIVAPLSEPGVPRSELAAKIRILSSRVRKTLGESVPAIERSNLELEKVVTPSQEAVRLYTRATRILSQMAIDTNEPIDLLKQALIADPDFASAHTMLALALQEGRGEPEDYLPAARRGYELSDRVTERERYFIAATYFRLSGQFDRALASYEALVQRYPDDSRGVSDLISLYPRLGQKDAAQALVLSYADLRPTDVSANAQAAFLYGRAGKPLEEEKYLNRAALAGSGYGSSSWNAAAWVQMTPVRKAWLSDQTDLMVKELNRAEQFSSQPDNPLHKNPMLPLQLGWAYATLGQFNAASERFALTEDPEWRNLAMASLAFLRGDNTALRKHLRVYLGESHLSHLLTSLFIRAGFVSEAAAHTQKLDPFGGRGLPPNVIQGDVALAQNDTAGISILESAIPAGRDSGHAVFFLAAESLASLYERQGNLADSIRVLEQMSGERVSLCRPTGWTNGSFWLRTQAQLARVYRKAGKIQQAHAVETQLRTLLLFADDDHPILVALNKGVQIPGASSAERKR